MTKEVRETKYFWTRMLCIICTLYNVTQKLCLWQIFWHKFASLSVFDFANSKQDNSALSDQKVKLLPKVRIFENVNIIVVFWNVNMKVIR